MRLVIVSGFLGVGKTSVMLALIEKLYQENLRFAVIENDFGKLGIDSKVMQRYGLEVKDLKGGCICCTLSSSLVETLRILGTGMGPDMVLIEPTGVADPALVVSAVRNDYVGPPIDGICQLTVVDAERFCEIMKAFERPITNHLKSADAVLINKADAVDNARIDQVKGSLAGIGFEGPVIVISAESGLNMDQVKEVVLDGC